MADVPKRVIFDFEVGAVVLAYHGSLLYEAKILSVQRGPTGEAAAYLVRFQGWKKSWDATVARDSVFEHNEENLRVAHLLLKGAKMRQQAIRPIEDPSQDKADGTSKDGGEDDNEGAAAKRSDTQHVSTTADALFQLPLGLKRQLVDDWEFITKEQRLVDLPRDVTVDGILQKWLNSRKSPADMACREVADGLHTYFNAALPAILLYRFERPQYNEKFHGAIGNEELLPSSVYGAEHLLRLLLKLPFMLENTGVDIEMMQRIAEKVNDLAKYMQKNGRTLFLAEYENASDEYIALVRKSSGM